MNLDDLKKLPSIREDFPKVGQAIDEYLVDHLLLTVLGSDGTADTAEREVGAAMAIANIINTFRSLERHPLGKRKIVLKPLHRFADDKTAGEGKPTIQ